ncbi:Major facilitator superfamily domain containing protein 6-like protein A [Dissostichus eleginoides]|uniref:Major facilitator superfamily domain containing protein 6-like protein A n=1 Tax=Dissostichus eleginoides TaxID=100907 RepID=A0AAD9BY29_DISEL|nr:Major facilitator superfamily domain containing protein 6-like protein A [Dissostichus eleginoides]
MLTQPPPPLLQNTAPLWIGGYEQPLILTLALQQNHSTTLSQRSDQLCTEGAVSYFSSAIKEIAQDRMPRG